jgi:hypothetical protein
MKCAATLILALNFRREMISPMLEITRRHWLAQSLVVGLSAPGLIATSTAWGMAQRPKRLTLDSAKNLNTSVAVELLTADGVGIKAREWSELFEELDVQISIRRSVLKEIPETTEEVLGTSLRDVRIVGRLERDGSITFSDRHYTTEDIAKIREWIDGMKAYGAQGTPKGQPMWGLTKGQFEPIYIALANIRKGELTGQNLAQALQTFKFQEKYPLRYSATAIEYLKQGAAKKTIQNEYPDLSEGAIFAAMLNELGLGFHPRRLPNGKIEFTIIKLGERIETWPAGWPPDQDLVKLRPELFQSREVELTDEPLLDVVQAIGDIVELPILIDEHGLKAKRIDIRTRKVSHKKKKVILSAALKHVCFQAKCKYEFRMDEGGNPLLWLTPDAPPADSATREE